MGSITPYPNIVKIKISWPAGIEGGSSLFEKKKKKERK
jgi:hypothetical protein